MFYRLYDTVAEIIKAVEPLYIDVCDIDMEKRPHMRCLIDFMQLAKEEIRRVITDDLKPKAYINIITDGTIKCLEIITQRIGKHFKCILNIIQNMQLCTVLRYYSLTSYHLNQAYQVIILIRHINIGTTWSLVLICCQLSAMSYVDKPYGDRQSILLFRFDRLFIKI